MDPEKTDLDEMDLEEGLDDMHLEEVYSFEITRYFSFSTLKMERKH